MAAKRKGLPPRKAKKKAPLKKPRLRKLGTLSRLTRGMGGPNFDGGSGMSRA